MTLCLGWFTAGRGPGSLAMFERALAAIDDGSLDARIEFVFVQRERGEGEGSDAFMDVAASRGITVVTLSARRFREAHGGDFASHRAEYDAGVRGLVRPYAPDLCVLAGYLLILSPVLTGVHRFVNLHPALPAGPVGLWQKVVWELIDARARETGVMTFLVTEELDKGPPITFTRVPLVGPAFDGLWSELGTRRTEIVRERYGEDYPLFRAIREAGVKRESVLLVETLKSFASAAIAVRGETVVDADGRPIQPRDLTDRVEAAIR